jgi:dihydroxyacetone kinase DhaKLM complex PTS-EIIA-like component DhaM
VRLSDLGESNELSSTPATDLAASRRVQRALALVGLVEGWRATRCSAALGNSIMRRCVAV